MSRPSIRCHLMVWVLGALSGGAVVLSVAAYRLTLHEVDELLDDNLRQTALLLADRDAAQPLSIAPSKSAVPSADVESKLVALTLRRDGTLFSTSAPELALRFERVEGHTRQFAHEEDWDVYTVTRPDRVVQVAQPISVRRELAGESAVKLLLPLLALIAMIGGMLVFALRRGLRPLGATTEAIAARSANLLAPLETQDVPTELVPMVATINDLLERLAAAFEAQRHFVVDAAHELRSPVTALQLQVQLLERSASAAERGEAIAELAAGIGRARRLIEQLLALSRSSGGERLDEGARCTVRLDDVARSVVERCSRDAERKGIDLGADATAAVEIDGNADQIEILLGNLVENALRYAPAGSVVDVVAGEVEGLPALRVIDNGPGIAPAERERVFDRFYRSAEAVSGAEGGSGLGLAIVRAIAGRHGAIVSLHTGRGGSGLEARAVFPRRF